jgi:glycolate oxidase
LSWDARFPTYAANPHDPVTVARLSLVAHAVDSAPPLACPPSLPDLLRAVKRIGSEYGFQSVCYGHAGDGNLHVNIVKGDMTDADWQGERLKMGIRQIFIEVRAMGGTISGEHGIGLVQREFMDLAFAPAALDLQRGIKALLDPNNILNPGKIFT